MGESGQQDVERQEAELAKRNREDVIAKSKGYVCTVCRDPLPKEDWSELTCSDHRGPNNS